MRQPCLYCDCELGNHRAKAERYGREFIGDDNLLSASRCRKCKDTGAIPTHYCVCSSGDRKQQIDLGKPEDLPEFDASCAICAGRGVAPWMAEIWAETEGSLGAVLQQGYVRGQSRFVQRRLVPLVGSPEHLPYVEEPKSDKIGVVEFPIPAAHNVVLPEEHPDTDDPETQVVDLGQYIAERTFENDEPMAHIDLTWCKHSFAVAFLIRDLQEKGVVLRPPKHAFERRILISRVRYLTNWQAWKWALPDLVHEEDWDNDPPEDYDPR